MAKAKKLVAKTDTATAKMARRRLIFNQIVLIFTIGCIFGTYYEEILTLVKNFWASGGEIIWQSRRGLVYGPFSPIYGMGAVGIYLLFYRKKMNWQACFFGGALLGGAFEYALSWAQEWLFGTRSWNYSDRWLDIGGRTTVPYMLFWGLLVLAAAKWLFPLLEKAYQKLEGRKLNVFCLLLGMFLLFDITMSLGATLRQAQRREGDPADNVVEQFFDKEFPDERLKQIYDNAVYVKD